jgi:hypothetical protein
VILLLVTQQRFRDHPSSYCGESSPLTVLISPTHSIAWLCKCKQQILPVHDMALRVDQDPFKDPSLDGASTLPRQQPPTNVPATLAVGRNASLTLGTDSLVVLGIGHLVNPYNTRTLTRTTDEALLESNGVNCCGVPLTGSQFGRRLPLMSQLTPE